MDITTKDKDPAKLYDKDNLSYDDIYAYGL